MSDGEVLLARALQRQGVDTMWTISAGPIAGANRAAEEHGIRMIGIRHEQAAAAEALAYGYVGGRIGVAMAGSGPGTTNTLTGVHNAYDNCWPLLLIGGKTSVLTEGLGGFEEADQMSLMRPITKWAIQVPTLERIPELVAIACHKAMTGRPGPVYLEIPGNVFQFAGRPEEGMGESGMSEDELEAILDRAPRVIEEGKPHGDPALIERAAQLLLEAERPLMLIGKGVRWSSEDTYPEFERLVDLLGMPFVPSPMGRGFIPDDHPANAAGARSLAMRNADLVLVVGARLNWIFRFGLDMAEDVKIIHIDVEPEEFGLAHDLDVGIVGDAGAVVRQLNEALEGTAKGIAEERASSPWRQSLDEQTATMRERFAAVQDSDDVPMNHYRMMREIRDFLPRDAMVVVDGELTLGAARQMIPSFLPGRRINIGSNACIGMGVPYAVGAKLAKPDWPVICITGDSAFGFNGFEIETAVRNQLPIVFVVNVNQGVVGVGAGREIDDPAARQKMLEIGNLGVGSFVPDARYDKIMEAFGGHGEYVQEPGELRPALERAFAADRPALINVRTDPFFGDFLPRKGYRQEMQY